MGDFTDLVANMNVWVTRTCIAVLSYLSYQYLKRYKTVISYIILGGLALIMAGIVIDVFSWQIMVRRIGPYHLWGKFMIVSQLLSMSGCVIAVYGCYRNVTKK